ncbi:MAG: trypsin-like serine protease, partial [Gammaproteobacteria bacterium]|nr:trypsin-like serine protease [Gammaproteobacteria bacterium]
TKVGWIIIPQRFNPRRVWICTGFLVGPDLFMTNHHCLHDDFGLLPLERAGIFMDYYQERDVDPTLGGLTARVLGVLQMDARKDYALLRLDRPIGNTYGWLELDTTTRVNSSQSVKLISHPDGRSKEIVRRNTEIVDIPAGHPLADDPSAIAYLADSEGGASGSPVFLREGTGVIAIHHSAWSRDGVPTFNAGSLMSHIVPEIEQYLMDTSTPDLVVENPRVSNYWLAPGEPFTLSVTVRNQGTVTSSGTTLRFYESFDKIITTSDIEIGSEFVGSLGPFETTEVRFTLTAPTSLNTYYYGACIDAIADETITDNNCSTSTPVTVSTTPPVYMYWTDWQTGKIQRATLNGVYVENVRVGLAFPLGIAVDVAGGHIYWTEVAGARIQRANLDGSNVQTVVPGVGFPLGLALDVAGGHIYWTDRATRSIQRANLNGSNRQTLVTELTGPQSLALDVAGGKMYWADLNDFTVTLQRGNLDGSNVETLIPPGSGLLTPDGLALDVVNRKMYWTDYLTDSIQRANLDGSNIETLIRVQNPRVLALDIAAEKMYWTAEFPSRIQRADLSGANVETLVSTGVDGPYGIALGIPPVIGTPSPVVTFTPPTIADQTFTVGSPVNLTLPTATGGTAPYNYTLSPIPPGLNFNAATQLLSGTPTTPGTTNATYTATDAIGTSASLNFTIEVTDPVVPIDSPLDVNGDGVVDVADLVIVATAYGTRVPAGTDLPADVNSDGVVNLPDLILVAQAIDAAGGGANAPSLINIETVAEVSNALSGGNFVYRKVAAALADAKLEKGVPETLLKALQHLLIEIEMAEIPESTALLPNYPNPFNPETWIPYHLATDADVTLTIYDLRGGVVQQLILGHQAAGVYESRGRAAYWDGKNQLGEHVASGVYFYSLTAGDFTATRKMLIAK